MPWFGFGFNVFGQITPLPSQLSKTEETVPSGGVRVLVPTRLSCCGSHEETPVERQEERCPQVRASWSRRAVLHRRGDGPVCLSGFGTGPPSFVSRTKGCLDALVSERLLTLAFADRVECWDMEGKTIWKMECSSPDTVALPLVPGGYVAADVPFYRPLSPQLCAHKLALGTEHAVLLTAAGAVYTWGSGSHGQLGHGGLDSQAEPQVVEALWGLSMRDVAAGGWHSACISAGGDLYVWGWNDRGQLGLPSRGLRAEQQQRSSGAGAGSGGMMREQDANSDVFISIQAFPALVDLPQGSEVTRASCGSRHTAAVACTGDLYTWGWGDYGQLGQATPHSSDQPARVDYFTEQSLRVVDVVCGPWNTFVYTEEKKAMLL
nr:PREDICTED: RCC1 domain-containing protein 1 isoform X1 [Lepisosteus oculatus]